MIESQWGREKKGTVPMSVPLRILFCVLIAMVSRVAHSNDLNPKSVGVPKIGARVVVFDRELANAKPVAIADRAGWYVDEEYFVGVPVEDQGSDSKASVVAAKSMKTGAWIWWLSGAAKLSAPITRTGDFLYLLYQDGGVKKVQASSGKVVWEYELSQYCDHAAVVANGKVLLWTVAQSLYALSEADGRVQWQLDAGSPSGMILSGRSKPFVQNANVWVGLASGGLLMINLETGQRKSEIPPDPKRLGRFKDALLVTTTGEGKILTAFATGHVAVYQDPSGSSALAAQPLPPNGAIVWERELEALSSVQISDDGQHAVAGHLDGGVQLLSLAGGKTVWEAKIYGTVQSLFFHKNSIVAVTTGGVFARIDKATGALISLDDLHASVISPALIKDNKAWVSTGQKALYSFDL